MNEGTPVRRTNPVALQIEIADLLIAQNRLLADIRDRLPEPTVAGHLEPDAGPQPVEVREPAPAERPSGEGAAGERDGGEVGPVQVTEPALPSPRRPAKKAAVKKTAGKRAERPAD